VQLAPDGAFEESIADGGGPPAGQSQLPRRGSPEAVTPPTWCDGPGRKKPRRKARACAAMDQAGEIRSIALRSDVTTPGRRRCTPKAYLRMTSPDVHAATRTGGRAPSLRPANPHVHAGTEAPRRRTAPRHAQRADLRGRRGGFGRSIRMIEVTLRLHMLRRASNGLKKPRKTPAIPSVFSHAKAGARFLCRGHHIRKS